MLNLSSTSITKKFLENKEKSQINEEFKLISNLSKKYIPTYVNSDDPYKNRYSNILTLDHTAVKLNNNNYINANHVSGTYEYPQKYICCQAPLPTTFIDFWTMIWEQNINIIVMLTNLIEKGYVKADQYWPDCVDTPYNFRTINIQFISEINRLGVQMRTFKIIKDSTYKYVYQFHYIDWPDKGIPDSVESFMTLINMINMQKHIIAKNIYPNDLQKQFKYELDNPIIVHCSAGIGRTGTFVVAHLCAGLLSLNKNIDILALTLHIRHQRYGMVQTLEQYEYIYKVVNHILSIKEYENSKIIHAATTNNYDFYY
jgi:protein tyrosine phosphatase